MENVCMRMCILYSMYATYIDNNCEVTLCATQLVTNIAKNTRLDTVNNDAKINSWQLWLLEDCVRRLWDAQCMSEHANCDVITHLVGSIMSLMTSSVMEERVNGLNTLAAIALDEQVLSDIVNSMIVGKVAVLLKDPSIEVRVVAAGALRNISAGGSDDVVEAMVQQEVLTPLAELLQEYREVWTPVTTDLGEATARDIDPMTNTFVHATHLLWNLCECSDEALSVFNQEGLVHILLRHIDPSTWGHTLTLAVAECLLCVSENNPTVASAILPSADSLVTFVSRPADSAVDLRFATTIAGVLLNINYCTTSGNNFQLVLKILSTVLETDTLSLVNRYAGDPMSTAGSKPSITPQDLEHLILAQQLALEILSNICCPEDEEDWDSCENISSDGEAENGCTENPMDLEGARDVLSPEVLEGITHFKLFEKTLNKINYPNDDDVQHLQSMKYGPSLLNKLSSLRIRSLLCVQNLTSMLSLSDIGGTELMYSTWVNLGIKIFQNSCTDSGLLEATTGAMRAIMDRLSQDKCEKLAAITQEDLKLIFEAGVVCSVASVRANLARMVGTLGCLIVTQNTEESLNSGTAFTVLSAATEYLLKVAAHDGELWVSAEALDVIIDLYSDDKTDKLAHNTHLVDRLKGIQPQFKSKHHQQKKKLGEHRALVLTVRDNLVAFIKYKSPRAAKYGKSP
ncbi:HEAT repeat-containing protein 3 isoform X2 [Procambarus clarkii]|uniref:HEAT repeat-containing protein 3 isoform X2 n=1 Tax=Procambarus clarkii TaxID=6728 RepID=UPI001E67568C|nr:HEAT repeat-containing protein 3-like isoform X2 [Procambarus clarkii]